MANGLNEFLRALFASEGGARLDVENKFGYIGKYQFGEDALIDLQYYQGDPSRNRTAAGRFKYDWLGEWTGKNGATSKEAFLASESIQDAAARDWVSLLCSRMKRYKLVKYIGETVGSVEVTESGIIAAAHLKGFGSAKFPGVIQFLKSNGTTNGADAFGTTVSDYMAKFAGYELGCCDHLVVCLRDREKTPIAGLKYEIQTAGQAVRRGRTDSDGMTRKVALVPGFTAYQVFVERLEGGIKQIAEFATPSTSALVTLISPKVKISTALEEHRGVPGTYRAGQVHSAALPSKAGKTRPDTQRGAKGNPVAVAYSTLSGGRKLSGASWETQFPTSRSIDDLTPDFGRKVTAFVEALKASGIKVRIAATYRPRERAYLMHYCCKIASGKIDADKVPPMDGVDIDWVHRDASGKPDVQASRAAARAMMQAYVIRYPAALASRHTQRRAIDMTITGFKDKIVKDADGADVAISGPNDLHALGRTYGLIKLLTDPPHWSDDGR